ncbi:MAP7 domain-containing protein 3 isoform X2 [Choloepus didactylus]|uniref:MAP7 domain-containing protein 3 isoform X2 n=1 Tax=Choloepus didactylus TaxID=27675 RepID=UPI00189EC8A7|nr:MAP7 domain-containing protein 3 isoform X2 [Choloepus didactylus]
MADGTGAGGSTSLRGLRERMVAAAHAIAEERRNQSGISSTLSHSSNIRSTFKPVIDGSVLKNDIKQRLAKERREESKRLHDANKEMQMLEKERKSKLQYEKQMEEKQRKLREQKERDEQRRASAEEKRKQKLEEERERFKAVLYRTLERSNRVDHRQKRWSWEGSATLNSENKSANKRSVSTEKLEQGNSAFSKQMSTSSAGLQNSIKRKTEKKRSSSLNRRDSKLHSSIELEQMEKEERPPARRSYLSPQETNLISRLLVPTKASLARSKSAASLSSPGKDFPGINNLLQPLRIPLRSHSSDELKTTVVPPQSTVKTPPQEQPEVPPQEQVDMLPEVSMDTSPEVSMETSPEESTETFPEESAEMNPKASVETSPAASVETFPAASLETSPETSAETFPDASVETFTDMSIETSPEGSMETFPEGSVETSPEVSMEVFPETSVEMAPEENAEAPPEVSVEVFPEASMEASPEAKKSEMDKQPSNPVTKKRLSSCIPCYRRSLSPARGWRPPSPVSVTQIPKNCPPSPSPVTSKHSAATSSLSYKIIPVQRTLFAPSALNTLKKRREAISKAPYKCETVSQINMPSPNLEKETTTLGPKISEEPSNKAMPGTMNAEEATRILAEKRRLARLQREKEEEKMKKEMELRRVKDMVKKADEGQEEEFSRFEDEQQQKEIKKKGGQDEEEQGLLLQKAAAKIKAQEEADRRRKEHERIMLKNLQERLERKKRIEEIMKRTRKTPETTGNETYEEDEADDEGETETDESFDEMTPGASVNGINLPLKVKTLTKTTTKKPPPKLVYLEAASDKETKASVNGGIKIFKNKNARDPLTQAKGTRPPTPNMVNRDADIMNMSVVDGSQGPSESLNGSPQEWICSKIIDILGFAEPHLLSPGGSPSEDHQQNVPDAMKLHPSPSTSFEDETKNPVSVQSEIM